MKKRSAPPLYELIRSRSGERVAPSRGRDEARHHDHGQEMGPTWLSPGRTVQLPVGYILLAGAAVLLIVVVTYMFGHSRGDSSRRVIYEQDFEPTPLAIRDERVPRDPLESKVNSPSTQTQRPASNSTTSPRAQNDRSSGAQPGRGWGPVESDPRQVGLNYFVLITTTPDGARRLAEYCRELGLETYVVSADNARRRQVIALPGFEPGQLNSPAAQSVQRLIRTIGQTWKDREPGASDLSDAILTRYNG